ncbi:PLP-dependent aminotransferase family protein [Myxococcota bacterium]|nr:PLP-dependent aminotransferase family protein [Myxococcota bacterium]MBU1413768.1 PLP-dependent aminotransferase family protein [Myxococcota bacterium]MBU1509589.1 PLP-dependent aminotransferase family protein [Myxococcota bacterium]
MISQIEETYSTSIRNMKRSVIRELLKLTAQPDIISFAGGLPSPESFPVQELKQVMMEMMDTEAAEVLQYGTTEGDIELRRYLVEKHYNVNENMPVTVNNLIITTASQQALDLIGKVFIDPGDEVVCGAPTYLGGINAFAAYGARFRTVELDSEGMRSDRLVQLLDTLKKTGRRPKFLYCVPDFQNPTGITMSHSRRREIVEIAAHHNLLIIEDSPYRELRFEGENPPTIYSMAKPGNVVLLGTVSKILCPSFRIGWVVGCEELVDKIVVAKQAADLCTSLFTQRIAARYMQKGFMHERITKTVALYKEKRDAMVHAFEEYMPPGVSWVKPEGGLFLFLTVPESIDCQEMFPKAIAEKVAYVIGSAFYPDGSGHNTMRLNFSFSSKDQIIEGVRRLAKVIKSEL